MSSFRSSVSNSSNIYITLRHFFPLNNWKEDHTRGVFKEDEYNIKDRPKFIVDQTTGDRYLNEPLYITSIKCLALAFFSAPFHLLTTSMHLLDLVFLPRDDKVRAITRIALAPLTMLGLVFSALYGVVNPLDGRKLYATLERFHSRFFSAECFQPSSDHHSRKDLLGIKDDLLGIERTSYAN